MKYRIGQGFDVHALVPGRPLILGGVTIPFERGLLGHSDLATTAGYAQIAEQPVREAAARVGERLEAALSKWRPTRRLQIDPLVAEFLRQGRTVAAFATVRGVNFYTLRAELRAHYKAARHTLVVVAINSSTSRMLTVNRK